MTTLFSLIALLAGTGALFDWFTFAKDAPDERSVNVVIDNSPIERTGTVPRSFAAVVEDVAPSVVRVNTTSQRTMANLPSRLESNPWFERFFDNSRGARPQPPSSRQGLGSGVIVSPDGYILTNNHVVQNASRIGIVLNDSEREYEANLIGTDPKSDLAVLKIDAENLPFVKIGNSDQIRVGDLVLAIGNPFGVGQTVTMGIVGATGRASMGLDYEDFIQTDAAINPGNSGGALIDVEGRLIGINTAILSKTGANQGIGFAIPTNLARNVMEDLIQDGHVTRGYLGVLIQDVSPQIADYFEMERPQGALVAEVTPRSPAAEAGLQTGDVILAYDDTEIEDSRHLKLLIGASDPDTSHRFDIQRGDQQQTIQATLRRLTDEGLSVARNENHSETEGGLDGVTVTDLDALQARSFQFPPRLRGALVLEVNRASSSWQAGLRPGDVITEINHERVNDADDAIALSQSLDRQVTLLRIWRNGSTRYLAVDESGQG